MTVTVLTTWFPTLRSPHTGAFVARDAAALAAGGHDVRLVHLVAPHLHDGRTAYTTPEGIRVHVLPMDPRRPDHVLRVARSVPALCEGSRVVHSMAVSALPPLAMNRPRAPWVHTEHWSGFTAPESLSGADRLAAVVARGTIGAPDVVVAVSGALAEAVGRYRRGPVRVVGNVVPEVARVSERPRDRDVLRLVSVGSLVPGKGPIVAVETIAELRRQGVPAELTWVGDGPSRPEMEQCIADLGLGAGAGSAAVRLVGAVTPEQVGAHLARSDYFLLPTANETFCVAAAEAIRQGLPVVLGARGGHRDFVTPDNGVLVARRDAEAYAAAVLRARDRFAGRARAEVAATLAGRFTPRAWARDYREVYLRALAPRFAR